MNRIKEKLEEIIELVFDVEEQARDRSRSYYGLLSNKVNDVESDINDKINELSERIDKLFTEIEELKSDRTI
tara:strand:- start:46 stop:261 length:216 start_codon:yes stop_codon:yes gene_type:complete